MFHVRVVLTGPIWRRHLNQLQTRYVSDSNNNIKNVPSTSDAVQQLSSESFNSKKQSLMSSFTKESSPLSVTPASDPTTSTVLRVTIRDDPAEQEDVQIFMFRSLVFICCAYFFS